MIRQLVAALAEAGVETDAEAIADALWLVRARRDESENGDHHRASAIRSVPTEPRPPDAEPQHPADSAQAVSERGSGRGPGGPARASQAASGPGAAASSVTLLKQSITLQRTRALPGALELGRALRPLKQRHSSKRNHVLDAEATVEYFCDTGVLTPVMRPGAERWFDVDVLIDAGPSMAVWQETGMELVSLLERHGAFREVRHWTLDQVEGKVRLSRAAGVRSQAPQLVDPGGRRITMVVTDCIGPMWYQAQIWDAIRGWGLFAPVVIVTMLPPRLWPRTALGSSEVIMRSHQPGAANRSLDAALPWWWPNDDPSQLSVPVPVITLEAGPVAAWARVVMGAGGVEIPGVLAKPPPGKTAARSGHPPPDAEERVRRFRVTMSPIAYRLAVYLSAALLGRWDLALARLVQEAMLPDSSQVHLAEVIVGGLVRQAERHTRHEEPMYEFVDGVPNVLQRSLTGTEALQVLQALGGHIERETGHSPGIAAMLLGETAPANVAEQFEDVRAGAANLIQAIGLAPGSTEIDQQTEGDGDRVTPDPLVLIVDDLAPNAHLLEAVLSPEGFRVATASSGEEALDLLGREHPDLVLLNALMPGMDGYEVCRRIRQNPETAFLPVIMIGESGTEEKIRAIESGADDLVNKPFDQAELLARVRSLVRVKRYHDTIENQAAELARWNRELEQRLQDQIEQLERVNQLRRFLPAQLADLIVSSGDESFLKGHRREITVVCCDLRGFTALAETAEPEDVWEMFGEYHGALSDLIARFEGTLERFTVDGTVVFFNDPIPCDDAPLRSVQMALAMHQRVQELADSWQRRGYELAFGVGIAQGYATLGQIGSSGRFDYVSVGSVTTLAARLCAEAVPWQILVTQRVNTATEDLVVSRLIGELSLRGFSRPVRTFEVSGLDSAEVTP